MSLIFHKHNDLEKALRIVKDNFIYELKKYYL